MQPQHDVFCDEQHLPRQQCNAALAPPAAATARPSEAAPVPHDAASIVEPVPVEEPASGAIREAVAMAGAPEPTAYASREWERTAAAVGHRDAARAIDADKRAGGGGLRRTAMVLAAIAVVLLTARGVRGRRGERV